VASIQKAVVKRKKSLGRPFEHACWVVGGVRMPAASTVTGGNELGAGRVKGRKKLLAAVAI